jgi:hypothetical protein
LGKTAKSKHAILNNLDATFQDGTAIATGTISRLIPVAESVGCAGILRIDPTH